MATWVVAKRVNASSVETSHTLKGRAMTNNP